jgi:hypothetical protein
LVYGTDYLSKDRLARLACVNRLYHLKAATELSEIAAKDSSRAVRVAATHALRRLPATVGPRPPVPPARPVPPGTEGF